MSDAKFSWIPAYEAIATALLDYEERQDELCAIVKDVIGESYEYMDSLTFFSMFNGKRRNTKRRIKAVTKVIAAFGLNEEVLSDFDGVPLTNPQRWRYWDGKPGTIEHNWEIFRAALLHAQDPSDSGAVAKRMKKAPR